MNKLMNCDSYIEPCYLTKAEQMREKVCTILAPENESSRDVSEVLLTIVRVALRLDWEPAPVPIPRLLVPLKHYYGLASACDNANRRQKRPTYFRRLLHVSWKSTTGRSSCKISPYAIYHHEDRNVSCYEQSDTILCFCFQGNILP